MARLSPIHLLVALVYMLSVAVGCSHEGSGDLPPSLAPEAESGAPRVLMGENELDLCLQCGIELLPVVSLVDSGGPITFSERGMLLHGRNNLFVVGSTTGNRFGVYDTSGTLLKVLGGAGNAPGEFARFAIPVATDSADRIWVWDQALHRTTIYTPDFTVQRVLRMEIRPRFVLSDGSLIGIQEIRSHELAGLPAHRFSSEGEYLSSFGQDPPTFRPDQPYFYQKIGVLDDYGYLWMAPIGRYQLEKWDPMSGELVESLDVAASWFEESAAPTGSYMTERPGSALSGLGVDSMGVIWVIAQTADRDWRRWEGEGDPPHEGTTATLRGTYFDFHLNAIHPTTGRVLADRVFDQPIWFSQDGSVLVTVEVSEKQNAVTYHVWNTVLKLQ